MHTEQRCEERGRRLGKREGTKHGTSIAGVTHTAVAGSPRHAQLGAEFLPSPLAASAA